MFGEADDALLLLARRRFAGVGRFISWCRRCGCEMGIDADALAREFRGDAPLCLLCERQGGHFRRRCPQESHDITYHGSRFHSGEW
jgi:hypothetical protein